MESMLTMAVLRGSGSLVLIVDHLSLFASETVPSSEGGVALYPETDSVTYFVPMAHTPIDSPSCKVQLIAVWLPGLVRL